MVPPVTRTDVHTCSMVTGMVPPAGGESLGHPLDEESRGRLAEQTDPGTDIPARRANWKYPTFVEAANSEPAG